LPYSFLKVFIVIKYNIAKSKKMAEKKIAGKNYLPIIFIYVKNTSY